MMKTTVAGTWLPIIHFMKWWPIWNTTCNLVFVLLLKLKYRMTLSKETREAITLD